MYQQKIFNTIELWSSFGCKCNRVEILVLYFSLFSIDFDNSAAYMKPTLRLTISPRNIFTDFYTFSYIYMWYMGSKYINIYIRDAASPSNFTYCNVAYHYEKTLAVCSLPIVELIWICFIVDSPGMNALISVSMDIVSLIHGIFF